MKKTLLVIISVLFLLTLAIFIFIPGKIIVTELRPVNTTSIGYDTCLHHLKKWEKWWPAESGKTRKDSQFVYEGFTYKLSKPLSDGATVQINSGKTNFESQIKTVITVRDSVMAEWRVVLEAGNNPLKRLSNYFLGKKLKKNIRVVFDALCQFADKTENIYDFPIERTTFTEVNLIAHRFTSTGYPGITDIYNGIYQLREYVKSKGASEKYYPMMNARQADSTHYETMIAISVDRQIPGNKEFFISNMVPMKDRFLKTEVTGGFADIQKAHRAIQRYMSDHALPSPAIPFEILVTERNKVTDTARWKTIIFYPSM